MPSNKRKMRKRKNRRNQPKRGYALGPVGSYTTFENAQTTFLTSHKYIALRYSDQFVASITTGVAASQIMNLNSVFDPDRTGTGHQPYGFGTLQTLYNRYRVLKCSYKITFATSAGDYHYLVLPLNNTINTAITTQATFRTGCEYPRAISGILGGGGAPSRTIRGQVALNVLAGATLIEYKADDRYEALVTASPSELMPLYIGLYNPTGSTATIYYQIEMTFYTDLHDPINLPTS